MQENVYNIEGNKKSWVASALHILIWLMVFLIPYIFSADVERNSHHKDNNQNNFLYLNTALNLFWVALFYFNASLLMRHFIYPKKTGWYLLILIGAMCLVILFDATLFQLLNIPRAFSIYHSIQHNFIPFVFTVAASTAYKAISDKNRNDMWIREKQSENLKTELSFLRSQVSPHFIFNVLNNVVALARTKSDELEPTILKLSSILQYMLYETDEEKVLLRSEAEYLKSYIDLQSQRLFSGSSVHVVFEVKEDYHTIEPMLLIPFVENAFKHGNTFIQDPEIHIGLSSENNQLKFWVRNRYNGKSEAKDKTSGIGLANVKRRLALLYPDTHTLKISDVDSWYNVNLTIKFKG